MDQNQNNVSRQCDEQPIDPQQRYQNADELQRHNARKVPKNNLIDPNRSRFGRIAVRSSSGSVTYTKVRE